MNKADLLEMIAISIARYEQANKYGYIPHFDEDAHCCWCCYSIKRTNAPKTSYNKAHRCTACPMLKANTPSYVKDCTDMYTYRIISPEIRDTWKLRLAFWKIVQRRIIHKDDPLFFSDLKNISVFLWEIDEMIRLDFKKYLKSKN